MSEQKQLAPADESKAAVAKRGRGFLELLESRKAELEAVCVKALNPSRLMKLAQQAYSRVPKLNECDPASIYMAVLHCAETGLEPGPLQHAAIVPYYNKDTGRMEAQFQAMYRGLLKLARQSKEVRSVHADIVHAKDEFRYHTDEHGRHLHHVPSTDPNPGEVTHAYMVAEIEGANPQIEVMTLAQLEAVRKKAKSQTGPWATDREEMYRKTVFKRGSKWLPLSEEAATAIAYDNETERESNGPAWVAPSAAARAAASSGIIQTAAPVVDAEEVSSEEAGA